MAGERACECKVSTGRGMADPEGMAGRRKRHVVGGGDARVERTGLATGVEVGGWKRDVGAWRVGVGRRCAGRGGRGGDDGENRPGLRRGDGASAGRLGIAHDRETNQVEHASRERRGHRSVTVGICTHGDKGLWVFVVDCGGAGF